MAGVLSFYVGQLDDVRFWHRCVRSFYVNAWLTQPLVLVGWLAACCTGGFSAGVCCCFCVSLRMRATILAGGIAVVRSEFGYAEGATEEKTCF